jgi:hypothetical protein
LKFQFINEFFGSVAKNKSRLLVPALVLVGLLLLCLSAFGGGEEESGGVSLAEYKLQLEEEIGELCRSVEGVGKCRVTVSFERGEELTYRGSVLIESRPPRPLGVCVVCQGGESDEVKARLVEMLSALFDIGKNRISVQKLNS